QDACVPSSPVLERVLERVLAPVPERALVWAPVAEPRQAFRAPRRAAAPARKARNERARIVQKARARAVARLAPRYPLQRPAVRAPAKYAKHLPRRDGFATES
ncbi:MAG TPA: hypothetical protein VFS95_14890, partial [Telluria sp.]|nr:hypothetical protein [Telluria sp.]